MNTKHILQLAANKTIQRRETVAEALLYSCPKLFKSMDDSIILIATHNVVYYKDIFRLVHATLGMTKHNPTVKIYIVTPHVGLQSHVFSRFSHISGVFRLQRLLQISNLIRILKVTKAYYALDTRWQDCLLKKYPDVMPSLRVSYSDETYATTSINIDKQTVLLSASDNDKQVRKISKTLKPNHIVLGNTFINRLACPQIMPTGYKIGYGKRNIIYDSRTAISMGIGLLKQYPYIKIGKQYNLFDYLRMYISD